MESPQATLPGRLTVILKNVRAVRELHDYIMLGDIEKDLITAQQALVRHLCQTVQTPEGWRRPDLADGGIRLHPEKKWNTSNKDTIAVDVFIPSPTKEDRDASVNLYVPSSWKRLEREKFTHSLRNLRQSLGKDWLHISDEPGEVSAEFPLGKWIRYEDHAGSADFDTAGFFQAIAGAVDQLLKLESEIDGLIEKAKTSG